VTSEPDEELEFFGDLKFPNPRPSEGRLLIIFKIRVAKEPGVTTLSRVDPICVMAPYEGVFNSVIKLEGGVVYGIHNHRRQDGVENLRVMSDMSKNISNGKVNIMNVDDGNQGTNQAMRTPILKPKKRGA